MTIDFRLQLKETGQDTLVRERLKQISSTVVSSQVVMLSSAESHNGAFGQVSEAKALLVSTTKPVSVTLNGADPLEVDGLLVLTGTAITSLEFSTEETTAHPVEYMLWG